MDLELKPQHMLVFGIKGFTHFIQRCDYYEEIIHMNVQEIKSSALLEHVTLRFLNNDDIDDLKKLCLEWFPLRYPDHWYKQVTNNPCFFSLAAVYEGEIIGVLIAEIRDRERCNKEDGDILGFWYPSDTTVAYILIVGAAKEYRRKGVASFLLNTFLYRVKSPENENCKVVYLHVLAANVSAVLFYERQNFKRHKHLPMYYTINGCKMDGYSYVHYVNDGKPPLTFNFSRDVMDVSTEYLAKFSICRLSRYLIMQLWALPGMFRGSSNTRKTIFNL